MDNFKTYSDGQLLILLKTSDQSAFNEIYNRYWKRMFAMAFLRLKSHEEAEDIVQDVFTQLWQHRKSEIKILQNWLATVTKYKIVNLITRHLEKQLSIVGIPETGFHDNTIDYRFLEQQIETEIANLPEKCRLVFQYSRQHGYSNREIANKLNISEKAVEKHITAARRKLSIQLRNFLHSILFFP